MKSENDCVYGLLMEVQKDELDILRKKEGYPDYYGEISVHVETFDGAIIRDVKTYKVVKSRQTPDHQPPTTSYMALIIENAKRYNFPGDYIHSLESIQTKKT